MPDAPVDLYNHPANLFVAGFIGSPKMNLLTGAIARKLKAATVGIRPEHVTIGNGPDALKGTVRIAEHLGSDTFLHIDVADAGQMTVRTAGQYDAAPQSPISLSLDPLKLHRFDESGKAIAA